MKNIIRYFYSVILFGIMSLLGKNMDAQNNVPASIYDIKINDIDGKPFDLSKLKGKKILIVNVASKCGFTPQYEDLEKLYLKYKDKLVIIGVPCNDFMGQEPGTPEEIKSFCSVNYNVTFPILEKVNIKIGKVHPLYKWLTDKKYNGIEDSSVSWNFNKYLIDETGKYVAHFGSKTKPLDTEITQLIEK